MAGYQKEILPSSWSPIVKYSVYNISSEEKEALGANIKEEMRSCSSREHKPLLRQL